MNTEYIKSLLEKYWEAETSLEEEKTLKDYFNGNDIDEDLKRYTSLFRFYRSATAIQMQNKEMVIPEAKVYTLPGKSYLKKLSIAASVAILLTVGYFMIPKNEYSPAIEIAQSLETGEITDEEYAMEVTLEALAYLGYKLDKSSNAIKNGLDKIEAITIIK
jgi:hypothetical protein